MTNKQPASDLTSEQPAQLRLAVGAAEEEIGAMLRHQRLKRKIAIDVAAKALKLSSGTLEEIERGNLNRFEALYRRGYVRNYARFLGLDPAPLLDMLRDAELPPLRSVMPIQQRGRNFDKFLRIATYAIVTTLIIPPIVLIYIQGGLDFLDRDRSLTQEPLGVSSVADAAPVEPDFVGPRPAADVDLEREGTTIAAVTASALPLNYIRPVRDPVGAARPEAGAPLSSAEDEPEMPDPRSTLVIELMDDSWLEVYAADGRRLEFDLLRAGSERRFLDEGPFRILAGRGSAITLELDGTVLEFDGQDRADVVTLEVSADGAMRR